MAKTKSKVSAKPSKPSLGPSKKYAGRPLGLDVSHHNGKVDWDKVKAAGVEFVFIKATEGGTYKDPQFNTLWNGAKKAGIRRGAYHFFRPGSPVQAQADNFVAAVKKLDAGCLPPVIDVEAPKLWEGISKKAAADMSIAFMEEVRRQLGSMPCITYAGFYFIRDQLGSDARLANYPLWLAQYRKSDPNVPKPFPTWTFWQFTETGSIDGITGNVDLNYFNGTLAQLDAMTVSVALAKANAKAKAKARAEAKAKAAGADKAPVAKIKPTRCRAPAKMSAAKK